jgi:hypothetical protein
MTKKQSLPLTEAMTKMKEASGTTTTITTDTTMTTIKADATKTMTITADTTTTMTIPQDLAARTTILHNVLMRTTDPPGAAPAINTRTRPRNTNTLHPIALTGPAIPPKKDHPLALPSLLRSNGMMIFLTKSNNTSPFDWIFL